MKRTTALVAGAAAVAASLSLAIPAGAALATSSAPAGGAPSLHVIRVAMNGKKISVTGDLQSGGARVISTVTREAQGNPTFVRLDRGVSVAQFLKALPAIAQDQNNVYGLGAFVFSPSASRGTSAVQVYLQPGRYVAADVGNHGGKPPLTTFTIRRSPAPANLPAPAAKVHSIEFGFRGPGTLRDGTMVRFGNHGFLVHMIVAARGSSKAVAEKIARLLHQGRDNAAQHLADNFATFFNVMSHGGYEQQILREQTGWWVLACFMDTQDGREHTQLGMERVIRIVK